MSVDVSSTEWRLIALRAPLTASSRTDELVRLVRQLVDADFQAVLFSPEAKVVLADPDSLRESDDPLTRLIIGIALLHAFLQENFTGPPITFEPSELGELSSLDPESVLPALTLAGEPAYHLSSHPVLLLLARRVIHSIPASSASAAALASLPWWKLRVHAAHQSLLDEPVACDLADVLALTKSLSGDLFAALQIEVGLYHHALGNDKLANVAFAAAAQASGLRYELTGALGKKTKFQQNDLSQLVLLAESREREGEEDAKGGSTSTSAAAPTSLALNDDTLLEEISFTATPIDPSRPLPLDPANQPALHPLDQSLLLGLCLNTHNSLPSSGLTSSEMLPFVTRVAQHPRNWSVHTTALLLRSRLEAGRSRTVERATLQLQALIDQMPSADSATHERLAYVHQLPLPSKWEMERELAKRFMSVGVTRSALEIFARLEMWEDAVGCMQRLDREDEAERVVRDLLEGRKVESELVAPFARANEARKVSMTSARKAKLWCLLGDIALASDEASRDPEGTRERAKEMYETAWKEAESSRSRRSLGSLLVSEGKLEEAIPVLRDAVRINPLYARVWFTLGVCFTRLERWEEARDAFRRQVGVDEEDGEGWNNLAAVYLRMGDGKSAFEQKILAFRALRTGLRYAPANWRMWANYMLVAIDVGELAECARAMTRLLEEQPVPVLDPDVLDKLVDGVTADDYNGGTPLAPPTTSNEGWGLLPIVERLFEHVVFVRVSDDPRAFSAHARLCRWKEDWGGALDDYVKAYRCGVAASEGAAREVEMWREGVTEVEELVGVMQTLGPKSDKGDWRFQARGVVRTFMGRTRDAFEDQPEWERLTELMDELKTKA